jgi:5-methylcytosine-specific restriction endonuclease McrA
MPAKKPTSDSTRLDRIIAEAKRSQAAREKGYREQALKLYPWICARCGREFTRATVQLLEVHHRDHNHDNNPPDGSNWELLCTYCHEHEHSKLKDSAGRDTSDQAAAPATQNPFADLKARLDAKKS